MNKTLDALSKLTGLTVTDKRGELLVAQKEALRVLLRALDGGTVSEAELAQARELAK